MELVQLDTLCQDLRDLQGIVQVLKDDNAKLKDDNKDLKDGLERVSSIVDEQSGAEKRKEIFYQEWLEGVLGGKHKRLSIGITDVSNDDLDVEIKVYRNAAMGVAQLNLYNSLTNAPNKVLALFDTPPKWKPSNGLVEICDLHAIRLVLLREDKTAKGIKTKFGKDSNWVDEHAAIRPLFIAHIVENRSVMDGASSIVARFVAENITKSETKYAHFTIKEATGRWRVHLGTLGPVPKEDELKRLLEVHLQTRCVPQVAIPLGGRRYHRPCGVFRGFKLL